MLDLLINISREPLLLLAVVTGVIVQALKTAGIASRLLPLVAILVGLLCGLVLSLHTGLTLITAGFTGIVAGGLSAGMYDVIKSLLNVTKTTEEGDE